MLSQPERRLRTGVKKKVIRLTPLGGEAESNPNKAKADNHVPCADTRNWIGGLAYVEDDDPEEAN